MCERLGWCDAGALRFLAAQSSGRRECADDGKGCADEVKECVDDGKGCVVDGPSPVQEALERLEGFGVLLMRDRVSSSFLGPVDPLFRALSGHLKCTVRRYKFNKIISLCRRLWRGWKDSGCFSCGTGSTSLHPWCVKPSLSLLLSSLEVSDTTVYEP